MASSVQEFDDGNFDRNIAKGVVLVDFWAPWCGPCRALTPIIERLATQYKDKAVVAKCDIDESTKTVQKYDIMSIPTVIIFKDGQITAIMAGGGQLTERKLSEALDAALA